MVASTTTVWAMANETYHEQEITLPLTPMTPNTNFSGESGTEQDPFLITIAEDLAWLAYFVNTNNTDFNNSHYRLANDIDLSTHDQGQGWMPIGINM